MTTSANLKSAAVVAALLYGVFAAPGLAGANEGAYSWQSAGGADWPPEPTVIAHRGASALRPEHTVASYLKAIEDGADVIEPDLVITKDGVLVARHENAIAILDADGSIKEATTNVAELPQFTDRKTTKTIDGVEITGWFVEDFTLDELKTLRARERIPAIRPANTAFNDQFEIPTFQEVIDLARAESEKRGRTIGIAPETKHPTFFKSIGQPLEPALIEILNRNDLNRKEAPVIVQSFEVGNLKELRQQTPVRLAQLIDSEGRPYDFIVQGEAEKRTYDDLITDEGLKEISTYADILAPYKTLIVPVVDGKPGEPTGLAERAHAAGLAVVIWTLRPENSFLPAGFRKDPADDKTARGDSVGEITVYLKAGVNAFFSDDSAVGRAAADAFAKK
ncbi:glycerophosphodiester phosphodiesterase [Pseudochelatococcus sp. B33]